MTLFWVEAEILTNLTCHVPRESRVFADVRHDEVDRRKSRILTRISSTYISESYCLSYDDLGP